MSGASNTPRTDPLLTPGYGGLQSNSNIQIFADVTQASPLIFSFVHRDAEFDDKIPEAQSSQHRFYNFVPQFVNNVEVGRLGADGTSHFEGGAIIEPVNTGNGNQHNAPSGRTSRNDNIHLSDSDLGDWVTAESASTTTTPPPRAPTASGVNRPLPEPPSPLPASRAAQRGPETRRPNVEPSPTHNRSRTPRHERRTHQAHEESFSELATPPLGHQSTPRPFHATAVPRDSSTSRRSSFIHADLALVDDNRAELGLAFNDVATMLTLFSPRGLRSHVIKCNHIIESLQRIKLALERRVNMDEEVWKARNAAWSGKYDEKLVSLRKTIYQVRALAASVSSSNPLHEDHFDYILAKLKDHEHKFSNLAHKLKSAIDKLEKIHLRARITAAYEIAHRRKVAEYAAREDYNRQRDEDQRQLDELRRLYEAY